MQQSLNTLPLLRSISDAAEEVGVPQHVLRFWETKFRVITPIKRAGGRRYYREEDIGLLQTIRDLLYEKGYTVKGVQKLLQEKKRPPVFKLHTNSDNLTQLNFLDTPPSSELITHPIDTQLPGPITQADRQLMYQNLIGLINDLQQLKKLVASLGHRTIKRIG